MNTKRKRMYPHQCRICGKTYYNTRDSKKQGTCSKRCSMIHTKITGRLELYPLRDAAALMKHLRLIAKNHRAADGGQAADDRRDVFL